MQIIPADYGKEEERVFAKSLILGLFGIPLGFVIAISFGFLNKEVPQDPIGWLVVSAPLYATVFTFWWLATIICSFGFWSRERKKGSWKNLKRVLSPTLVIPLLWLYVSFLFAFIFNPFNSFFLQYYNPISVFWLGALVFLPFMLMFVYVVIPHSRPTMRRNLRVLYDPKSCRNPEMRSKAVKFWVLLSAAIAVYILNLLLS